MFFEKSICDAIHCLIFLKHHKAQIFHQNQAIEIFETVLQSAQICSSNKLRYEKGGIFDAVTKFSKTIIIFVSILGSLYATIITPTGVVKDELLELSKKLFTLCKL
jgi:hypothetical protein